MHGVAKDRKNYRGTLYKKVLPIFFFENLHFQLESVIVFIYFESKAANLKTIFSVCISDIVALRLQCYFIRIKLSERQ